MLIEYPSIRGDYLIDHANKSTWNLLNTYIYAHSQILIYEYWGYGLQVITRLQSQCANMNLSDKISYNRLSQQVLHKLGES